MRKVCKRHENLMSNAGEMFTGNHKSCLLTNSYNSLLEKMVVADKLFTDKELLPNINVYLLTNSYKRLERMDAH